MFSNLFQANLYDYFSKTTYYENIDTLEELVQSNLTISTSLHVFDELDSDTYKALRERVVDTSERNMSAIYLVAYHRNTSNLERLSDAKLLVKEQFLTKDGTPRLHIVKECLNSYLLSYIIQKHSPYRYYFNHVLVRLSEAGFMQKWNDDVLKALEIEKWNVSRKRSEFNWRKLNNKDLQIAYMVLVIGYFLCFICFLREILIT